MLGISDLGRYVSGGCAAVAILAGCGGSGGAQVVPAGPMPQSAARSALHVIQPNSIVYTPVNEQIKNNGQLGVDLNNDGTNDFTLSQSVTKYIDPHTGQPCGFHLGLYLTPSQSSNGVANGTHVGWTAALNKGWRINSKLSFEQSKSLVADVVWKNNSPTCPVHGDQSDGYWWEVGTKYLGLEFQVQGQTHYGWAQLETNSDRSWDEVTTLTGYAYQTIAGQSIRAGRTK